jgi:hypothetical protein
MVANETQVARGRLSLALMASGGCCELRFPEVILVDRSAGDSRSELVVEVLEAVEAGPFIRYTGSLTCTKTLSSFPEQPVSLALYQNSPNPFNPATTIRYSIPRVMEASLVIYSSQGQKIKTLHMGVIPPGNHTVKWNGKDEDGKAVASGLYFYTLTADRTAITRQMIFIQ